MNNNYNSNTVVKQDFAVVKQVDGRAAHMTGTSWIHRCLDMLQVSLKRSVMRSVSFLTGSIQSTIRSVSNWNWRWDWELTSNSSILGYVSTEPQGRREGGREGGGEIAPGPHLNRAPT